VARTDWSRAIGLTGGKCISKHDDIEDKRSLWIGVGHGDEERRRCHGIGLGLGSIFILPSGGINLMGVSVERKVVL